MNDNGAPKLSDMLAGLESAVQSAPLSDLPALLGHVEKVRALGWGRMLTGPHNGQPEPTKKNALTAEQVAAILNVRPSFVYEMARQGKLKSYRVGKYLRFREAAVQEFLVSKGA